MLNKFKNYLSEKNKQKFIENAIDNEIKKTFNFGLEIEKNDILLEKKLFIIIFKHYWVEIENIKSDNDYNILKRIIIEYVFERLSDKVKYYIEKTKDYNVKNMYQCHISNTINVLFLKINNKLYDR